MDDTRNSFLESDNSLYDLLFDDIIKKEDNSVVYSNNKLKIRDNNEFKKHIVEKFQPFFISTLKNQELEIDFKNSVELQLEDLFNENEYVSKDWLNDVFTENFNDTKFLVNILKIIGNFNKELISSFGIVTAGAALSHKNVEVKEMAIRVFENWNTIKSYSFLKQCCLTPKWLDDYKNKVLSNIEEELCLI
ncbi:hypothetical protein [Chishuiella changwenlii]|uniref:hypothetical protein n=1 Tax=Chishuiella changwenlii TaxID=1434701 RepID=UPI002FD9D28E